MDERTDFSLDEGDHHASHSREATETPPPVIVIEYRQRGLLSRLTPAALILMAAIAITTYQRTTPVYPLSARPRPIDPVAKSGSDTQDAAASKIVVRAANLAELAEKSREATPVATNPGTTPPAEPAPRIGHDVPSEKATPEPPTAVAKAETEAPKPQPSPFEFDPSDGLKPLEKDADLTPVAAGPRPEEVSNEKATQVAAAGPAVEPIVPPVDAPAEAAREPSKEDILRDIQREADETEGKKNQVEELKTDAQAHELFDAIQKIHSDRSAFHRDLKEILKDGTKPPGPEIEDLCNRYGRDMMPEVKVAYSRAQRTVPGRMKSQDKVELMRGLGVPEAVVFDYLADIIHKTMNTRGGPRDRHEVRVRAAKALIAIPLPAARKGGSPAGRNDNAVSVVAPGR